MVYRLALLALFMVALGGCSFISGTSLECGSDGNSTYVKLNQLPQDLSGQVRHYSRLCGFVYDTEEIANANAAPETTDAYGNIPAQLYLRRNQNTLQER